LEKNPDQVTYIRSHNTCSYPHVVFDIDTLTRVRVFNATFNNISVVSWRSALLVEETGEPGENHRPAASHLQMLSHTVVHLALIKIRNHMIGTDCIGSC